MTNVKCIRCGVINVGTDDVCKACAIELDPLLPPSARPTLFPFDQPAIVWQPRSADPSLVGPFDGPTSVVGPTFRLFFQNLWLITKITFVIVAPFEIFSALSVTNIPGDLTLGGGIFVLDLLCHVLIAPALIFALMKVMQTGAAPSVNQAYLWGASKLGKLVVCAAIAALLQTIGLAFCIIPGIMIGLALELVYPLAVLEKGSVQEVLLTSKELTKGHRWNILGALILTLLPVLAANLFGWVVAQQSGLYDPVFWPLHVIAAIGGDILEQSTTVLSLVIYLSIRRTLALGNSVIQ